MNKDLLMHFRVHHKLVDVPTRIPGTSNIVNQKIIKPFLGKRGPNADTFGGVTVVGMRMDHPLLGMIIKWGVALCVSPDKYKRKEGYENAVQVALEYEYVTKDVSYENAKEIGNVIAKKVWENQNINNTMEYLFDFTKEALPVEGSYVNRVPK